ncbi:hypothetical protein DFH06DRAFT_1168580 [Mycena polygramma]|nr:hypothetical protein DFH06DRAFT_1168580 [Mycena polygramma]
MLISCPPRSSHGSFRCLLLSIEYALQTLCAQGPEAQRPSMFLASSIPGSGSGSGSLCISILVVSVPDSDAMDSREVLEDLLCVPHSSHYRLTKDKPRIWL